jgi:cell cycle sensor histidine kinase DivJ
MNWLDDWLAGLVHRSAHGDLTERSRHERFMVARTAGAIVALAGLPPYLLSRGVPTALECLALVALATPIAAVFVLSRLGSLAAAQGLVSAALTLFVAGAVVAFGGAPSLAALAFLVIPLDAFLCGSKRAILAAGALALIGVPLMMLFQAEGLITGTGTVLITASTVAAAYGFGHALAHVALDRRFKTLLAAALRSGEAKEGAALQAIDDLVTWHDRNGSVMRANAAAGKLVGVPAALLQGRGLFSRIHVADRPAYLKAISDAAVSTEPVVVEFRLQTGEAPETFGERQGMASRVGAPSALETIWVEMRAHRLPSGSEGCVVVAVTRDITDHKQHAEELEALRRQAELAGEGRAQLLATVSHELRTPLNAIIGYSEVLMGRGAPVSVDQRQDYAEIIHQSGQHMLGVVTTLLDLSTIEAGRYDLHLESIDVADLVSEGCRLVSLSAHRAGVALAQDVAPGLPELRADRRACRQILLNLLSNAVKFTPEGGLVTVQARRDGDRLALTVCDTGVGVCETELPRLGNPFYRAPSARSRQEKGTGLGLSVVRGLVGLHQGRISLSSAPGDGMSVSVSLPFDAGHSPRATMPAEVHTFTRARERTRALKMG